MNFVVACLPPPQNVKLGIFTGSGAVDGKECTKQRDVRAKLLFCLVKLNCLFDFFVAAPT